MYLVKKAANNATNGESCSIDLEKLHLKCEIGISGNHAAGPSRAVAIFRRDLQDGFLSNTHLHHTDIPTLDHLTNPNLGLEGLATINTGVELLPVGSKGACVVHGHGVTLLGIVLAISLLDHLLCSHGFEVGAVNS